jgi:NAD(P)-dependent dehydrogenase (short-subunit alcohol dehydrogenase family)
VRAPVPVRAIDTLMDRSLVLGYTKVGLRVRRALPGWPVDPAPAALAGRDVIVTGASSGLGIATVEGLAALGAAVHLVVRDEAKGGRVRDDIAARQPQARLRVWRCDIGDLDDVRRFAHELGSEVPTMHAAIHNAGVMPPERTESAQGHELSMAVHLLGPVVMTEALLPQLSGGRVVLVSSGGLYGQPLRADDPDLRRGDYSPTAAYARSKRMQVEMLPLLADRWSLAGVTTAAMHPGWVDTPGVQESLPRFRALTRSLLRDEAAGADTSVWLAATEPPPPTALFWHDRRARPINLLPTTRADESARATAWAWLRDAAGLTGDDD